MGQSIKVYDLKTNCFRELKPLAHNVDRGIGIVIFSRNAIEVFTQFYRICGYCILDEYGTGIPIDIQNQTIVLFEEDYELLCDNIKRRLLEYNLVEKPKKFFSDFFVSWQFKNNPDVFGSYGPFYRLCSLILGSQKKLTHLIRGKLDIVYPTTYHELCRFVQRIGDLFSTDFYDKGYSEKENYIIDSLMKGYRIEMCLSDIEKYCWAISNIACDLEKDDE